MQPKPVLCTCSKRFNSDNAMLQHQRDSLRHVAAPQAPEQILCLDQRDQEANYSFIPLAGGRTTTSLTMSSNIHISEQAIAKKSFIAEGLKPKKKKARKETSQKIGQGSYSSSEINPNTGQIMNLLEDQDWALCDKDCGWCGHCAEGALY